MYFVNFETFKEVLKTSKTFQISVSIEPKGYDDSAVVSSKIDVSEFARIYEEIEVLLTAKAPLSIWGNKMLRMIPYESVRSVGFTFS